MKITNVHGVVEVKDENGDVRDYRFSSPTIDMAIEKMGAIERSVERENKNYIPDTLGCSKCGDEVINQDALTEDEKVMCGNCAK